MIKRISYAHLMILLKYGIVKNKAYLYIREETHIIKFNL